MAKQQITQQQADAFVAEMQKILRLQDWNIKVKFSNKTDGFAKVTSDRYKNALITLYPPPSVGVLGDPDPYLSLTHEIIHLHLHNIRALDKVKEHSADDDQLEIAIELIAQAILNLKCRAEAAEALRNAQP
jgi:hypothetical protein